MQGAHVGFFPTWEPCRLFVRRLPDVHRPQINIHHPDRLIDFLMVQGPMDESFRYVQDCRTIDGMLFSLSPQRHLNFGAKLVHIVRIITHKHYKLVTVVFVRLFDHAKRLGDKRNADGYISACAILFPI
jgi:hypothetical protein